jgi:hypothetical protein
MASPPTNNVSSFGRESRAAGSASSSSACEGVHCRHQLRERGGRGGLEPRAHRVEMAEVTEHEGGLDTEIDEARHIVDPNRRELLRHGHASVDRAEQAAGFEISLEGILEQRVGLLLGQRLEVQLRHRAVRPLLERRKCLRVLFDEADGRAQVGFHRRAHEVLHVLVVVAHERVQHERDVTRTGVPGRRARRAIHGDLLAQLVQSLSEQVREHSCARAPRGFKGVRASRRCHEHRELGLHGSRMNGHLHRLSIGAVEWQ